MHVCMCVKAHKVRGQLLRVSSSLTTYVLGNELMLSHLTQGHLPSDLSCWSQKSGFFKYPWTKGNSDSETGNESKCFLIVCEALSLVSINNNNNNNNNGWVCSSVVEYLPGMCKVLYSAPKATSKKEPSLICKTLQKRADL